MQKTEKVPAHKRCPLHKICTIIQQTKLILSKLHFRNKIVHIESLFFSFIKTLVFTCTENEAKVDVSDFVCFFKLVGFSKSYNENDPPYLTPPINIL